MCRRIWVNILTLGLLSILSLQEAIYKHDRYPVSQCVYIVFDSPEVAFEYGCLLINSVIFVHLLSTGYDSACEMIAAPVYDAPESISLPSESHSRSTVAFYAVSLYTEHGDVVGQYW